MSSNINPNNIDTAYPVAGQDNDSQGFRDNFTNIKTNFEFAAEEINDLESKVLLKSALTGTTLDNDMGGAAQRGGRSIRAGQARRICPFAALVRPGQPGETDAGDAARAQRHPGAA